MITRKEASMYFEVNIYYESLWNHVVVQQWVFNRLKITLAISMNKSENKSEKYLIL